MRLAPPSRTSVPCRYLSITACQSNSSTSNGSGEPPKGHIHDKKPVKLQLEAGKLYSWCTCGRSKKQPFCDGSHKQVNESSKGDSSVPPFRSHKFQIEKTKDYFLCNCKQTNKRPFCDGTHKEKSIQDTVI